jgi:hypothetical protein
MRTDHQIMSTASNDKWAKAEAGMTAELLPILKLLKADYQAASNIHIPNWKGGPNARILAELVRMGWRKMEANTLQQRLVVQGETTSATAATDETALRLAALAAEVRGLKDLLAGVRANHGTGGPNERILVELLLMGRRKSKATVNPNNQDQDGETSALELALPWGFVWLPLLWGVYGTLVNAMKLFQ